MKTDYSGDFGPEYFFLLWLLFDIYHVMFKAFGLQSIDKNGKICDFAGICFECLTILSQ